MTKRSEAKEAAAFAAGFLDLARSRLEYAARRSTTRREELSDIVEDIGALLVRIEACYP